MLSTAAIFLAAAVVAVTIFRRIGLGSVLGYLVAGALVGPHGLGLVHEVEGTMSIAELGVVLLLFLIGLELQPSRLWSMRRLVFGLGGAQVVVSALVLALVARALGASLAAAGTVGVALAMSSTAFASQILSDRGELGSPYGRAAFGILLFQDIAAIPVLAVVPLLGKAQVEATRGPLLQFALVAGVIAALVVGGRLLLRPAFRLVSQARSQELSTATALLVVLGTAMAVHSVGLSMALGAFIAGVLLADSEYRHELEADIEPFKGLLLGLFFMAVGMSANLRLLVARPLVISGLVVLVVVAKLVVLYVLGRVTKLPARAAAGLGVAISQGGEFALADPT
jgi:monovalent cation:proton antiporter-2 (CPA2) family protein